MVFQDGAQVREHRGGVPRPRRLRQPDRTRARCPSPSASSSTPASRRERAAPTRWREATAAIEYDTLGDQYAPLPPRGDDPGVGEELQTHERSRRATRSAARASAASAPSPWPGSGRTDFRKVISHIGSFTNIRGGHVYPTLVRKRAEAADPRSSCRTAPTTSTTAGATGPWPTSHGRGAQVPRLRLSVRVRRWGAYAQARRGAAAGGAALALARLCKVTLTRPLGDSRPSHSLFIC